MTHHAMQNVASEKTRLRLTEIMAHEPWNFSTIRPPFGNAQCRFCGIGWPDSKGWYKFAVRHYACVDCAKLIVDGPFGVYKKRAAK